MKVLTSDITIGDRLTHLPNHAWARAIVVHVSSAGGLVNITAVRVGSLAPGERRETELNCPPDVELDVERADLTPAQKHADQLEEMLWRAANFMRGKPDLAGIEADARELLARLQPPKPPTAQELAANLAKLANDGILPPLPDYALTLLARARQAGML